MLAGVVPLRGPIPVSAPTSKGRFTVPLLGYALVSAAFTFVMSWRYWLANVVSPVCSLPHLYRQNIGQWVFTQAFTQ